MHVPVSDTSGGFVYPLFSIVTIIVRDCCWSFAETPSHYFYRKQLALFSRIPEEEFLISMLLLCTLAHLFFSH